ncbi:MAG: putative inorganic carbon transporter subunit DabA, partial [Pseudomonadota bacterium]
MTTAQQTGLLDTAVLDQAADAAARQIPPVFPLAASVAVNPFLGQTTGTLAEAGARLARIGGVPVTMPRRWYQTKIATGEITDADLQTALDRVAHDGGPADLDALKSAAKTAAPDRAVIPTVADLAGEASGTNWTGLIDERFGAWAAGYFDDGQALWAAPKGRSAWDAFRIHATHDLTPEIMGLRRFAAFVAEAPERASEAIARASIRLGLWPEGIESYFHQLLFTLGGWAQYARYELWQAELAGHGDATITDFLAIRLLWEEALYDQYGGEIDDRWAAAKLAHAGPAVPDADATTDTILQHATEIAAQRGLAETLAAPSEATGDDRPTLQAAFCIDVRSEVFRRALESVDSGIRTLGFAGFFGVFAEHKGFASDVAERRLPVLLNPTVTSASGNAEAEEADTEARYTARAKRAWGRFKLAAVSSFAFVEAMGPVYAAKLARDALALHADAAKEEPKPEFSPALDAEARLGAAETVLRAMSLTSDFARVVVLAGHGANVTNNPFESGLHCRAKAGLGVKRGREFGLRLFLCRVCV